ARRLELYQQLVALRPDAEELGEIAEAMVLTKDPRALPLLWELANRGDVPFACADALARALRNGYLGTTNYRQTGPPPAAKKAVIKAAKEHLDSGTDLQRLLALKLLAEVSLEDAGAAAQKIRDDARAAPELRQDAFQVSLL